MPGFFINIVENTVISCRVAIRIARWRECGIRPHIRGQHGRGAGADAPPICPTLPAGSNPDPLPAPGQPEGGRQQYAAQLLREQPRLFAKNQQATRPAPPGEDLPRARKTPPLCPRPSAAPPRPTRHIPHNSADGLPASIPIALIRAPPPNSKIHAPPTGLFNPGLQRGFARY